MKLYTELQVDLHLNLAPPKSLGWMTTIVPGCSSEISDYILLSLGRHLYQLLPMSLNSELTCSTNSFRVCDSLLKQASATHLL